MAETVAPEFLHFVAGERRANRLPAAPQSLTAGDLSHPVFVEAAQATALLRVAARRAVGLFRPSRRTEVVWVHGDSELAVDFSELQLRITAGLLDVMIPVRCDQTGHAIAEVFFSVGSPDHPAGLFASTLRRPKGPPIVVSVWGDALVAFAWQCLLGMMSGIAGATGKDDRGNVLVPVELVASKKGLQIVPMARHRFAGSTGLRSSTQAPR